MTPLEERRYSFVVKIWEERRDVMGAKPIRRGSVDDVRDGTRIYFGTLVELCNYLHRRSGMNNSQPRWRDRLLMRIRHQ